jgi:ABC-type glycerol-3-phosphate transport system substrate-binding protein
MIDRNSPIPLYYQLKLYIKQQVEDGELKPGDRLLTEMELCDRFDISRAPVRQALTELAREGLIYRRPGQGSFIAPLAPVNLQNKTKIVVLSHLDVRWMTSLEEAVLTWNATEPDREVELDIRMCSQDDYHQTLRRMAIQGEAPDIAPLDYVWVHHYASEGYIAPLNALDAIWVDEICHDLELPVLKNNTIDGLLYGLPFQADLTGLWYRIDWFRQEGINPPVTWSDWLECIDYFAAPDVMKRLGHQYALVLPVTSSTGEATLNLLIAFIWLAGGYVVDTNGKLSIEDPAVYRAIEFLRKITLDRRPYLPEDVYKSQWWDLVRFFAQGIVPMALGGTYEWSRIREESQWVTESDALDHLGFTLLPRPSTDIKQVASLGGTSWTIFSQSKVQDVCLELFKIVALRDVLAEFCIENLQISPFVSVNKKFMAPVHPWLSSIVPLLKHARNRPMVRHYLRLSKYMQALFEKTLWDGATVEDAVKQTSTTLSLILSEVMV